MSGHSKWSTIKRKKEKTDGARAKVFTKIGRELAVAVREGGSADPSSNSKLRDCIAKAKANNVPNDNIERIIKKAAGDNDSSKYGCVSFMFEQKGVIVVEREGQDEDKVMEDALEAGAADFQADDDVFEIYTEPEDFSGVREDLQAKGYTFVSADVEMVPSTYVKLTDEESITKMQRLMDALEDNDDVQNIWHNWEAPESDDED